MQRMHGEECSDDRAAASCPRHLLQQQIEQTDIEGMPHDVHDMKCRRIDPKQRCVTLVGHPSQRDPIAQIVCRPGINQAVPAETGCHGRILGHINGIIKVDKVALQYRNIRGSGQYDQQAAKSRRTS